MQKDDLTNKKILVVNDIPGVGRVAGSINLPVLAAAQLEAAFLPTLILSSFAGAEGDLVRHQMGKAFAGSLNHWQQLDYRFDGILTGYFAETRQIDDLKEFVVRRNSRQTPLRLYMDPIMGDHGRFYKGFDREVALHLRELIPLAEVVMPNLTEACFILGRPYHDHFSRQEIEDIASEILDLGCQSVVLTGARDEEQSRGQVGFYYASQKGQKGLILHDYFEGYVYGTGDLVISLVTAFRLANYSLDQAVQLTADLVVKIIPHSIHLNKFPVGPVHFEPFIVDIARHFISKKEGN